MTAGVSRSAAWALLLAAAVAVSVYAVRDEAGGHADEHAAPVDLLVPLPAEAFAAVEVLQEGRLTRFDRTVDGQWFLHPDEHAPGTAAHAHTQAATAEGGARIAQALAMFARARVERRVGSAAEDRRRFGLVFPGLVVSVFAADMPRPVLTLEVGDLAPDGLSRYVLAVERGAVLTIPDYHVANLTALLSAARADGAAKPAGG